jgi:hypothetical protein
MRAKNKKKHIAATEQQQHAQRTLRQNNDLMGPLKLMTSELFMKILISPSTTTTGDPHVAAQHASRSLALLACSSKIFQTILGDTIFKNPACLVELLLDLAREVTEQPENSLFPSSSVSALVRYASNKYLLS